MSFCSFTKDLAKNFNTQIENTFIKSYLKNADGDAVKVYLYGLYVCQNSLNSFELSNMEFDLGLSQEKIIDCFKYWEEFGVVEIFSVNPFLVRYLPLSTYKTPKKINIEKYSDFNKSIQCLISKRMISTNEYIEYFNLMEENSLSPQALLMIVKYCIDRKDEKVSANYIIKVAKSFIANNLTTVEKIEEELKDYTVNTKYVASILDKLNIHREPNLEDNKLFIKWTKEFCFKFEDVIFVIEKSKIKKFEKLDEALTELYNNNCISNLEINDYIQNKKNVKNLTINIAKNLSCYIEILDPYIQNYVIPWTNKGYNEETLTQLSLYAFKKGKHSFEQLNRLIEELYTKGIVTKTQIDNYLKNDINNEMLIKKLLNVLGIDRSPIENDKRTLNIWRDWGFDDEIILEAGKSSYGKNNPFAYMNSILSSWKEVRSNVSSNDENKEEKIKKEIQLQLINEALNENEEYQELDKKLREISFDYSKAKYNGDTDKASKLEIEINSIKRQLSTIKEKTQNNIK